MNRQESFLAGAAALRWKPPCYNSALFEDASEYGLLGLAVLALSAQFFTGLFQFPERDRRLAQVCIGNRPMAATRVAHIDARMLRGSYFTRRESFNRPAHGLRILSQYRML